MVNVAVNACQHLATLQLVSLCVVVLLAEGAIFQGALFSRDLFLMHKCLNRDHHSCDKPLKAKAFFILQPSRAVQLKFNNAPLLWIYVETR